MSVARLARRFLVPRFLVSLYCLLRFRCRVSPRAEVELSPLLAIGPGSEIGSFTKIKASYGPLRIGARCFIGAGCFIASHQGGVVIGDDCLISPQASIIGSNYNYRRLDVPIWKQGSSSRGVRIGDDVWIGAGARILDGASIGSGVIVAANAVVAGSVPDRAIVRGDPARVVFIRR